MCTSVTLPSSWAAPGGSQCRKNDLKNANDGSNKYRCALLVVSGSCSVYICIYIYSYIFVFYLLKIRTFKYYLECKLVRSAAWQQEEIHIDKPCAMSIQWHECCHHVWKNGKIEWRIAPSPRRGRKLLPMSHRQCFAPHPEQSQKTRLHPFGLSHERPTLVY